MLQEQQCSACRADAPRIEEQELAELIKQIPDWAAVVINDVMQLERQFSFKTFRQALAFTNQVGELAEAEGHHPEITTEWGKVKVRWWTHKIRGLHQNDFICAAKTDALFTG